MSYLPSNGKKAITDNKYGPATIDVTYFPVLSSKKRRRRRRRKRPCISAGSSLSTLICEVTTYTYQRLGSGTREPKTDKQPAGIFEVVKFRRDDGVGGEDERTIYVGREDTCITLRS
jgi:hypothetical protein